MTILSPDQWKETPQKNLDPLLWLQAHSLYPKVFWKEKNTSLVRAAVGATHWFDDLPSDLPEQIRCYGGTRFSPSTVSDAPWSSFSKTTFWIPQAELSCSPQGTHLRSHVSYVAPEIVTSVPTPLPSPLSHTHVPSWEEWEKQFALVHGKICSKKLAKVVLARRTALTFSEPLETLGLLSLLIAAQPQSTLFFFQLDPHTTFLGATPEVLFIREGRQITTEAIAGTRPRGNSKEEDLRLQQELLNSCKDKQEFSYVKQALSSLLLPLSISSRWHGEDRVLSTSRLHHLYNQLTLTLSQPLSDAALIERLHPTPALGGTPRTEALEMISQLETIDRGWYGAPVGVISSERSAFYVAIRSALVKDKTLFAFAGVGLVETSNAKEEWEELDRKSEGFTSLFALLPSGVGS